VLDGRVDSVSFGDLLREGETEFVHADRWRVMRPAVLHRPMGRLDDGLGRREVRIADVESNDGPAARALHLVRQAEHGANRGERDLLDALGRLRHGALTVLGKRTAGL
jgi:hypothetical protein